MARKRATLTDLLNDLTYRSIYDKFKLIATNMFEWQGLPDGIEEKYIENLLFSDGKAIFFRDPKMSYMVLRADQGAHLNVYGEPLGWWATGFQYHQYYDADDCVIISNNKLRIPTQQFVTFYANKLAEAERTMDVNVKACKTPYIFACDDKDVLSFKQIFAKVDGNEPAIFADRGLNLDALQVFQTGVKFIGNDMQDYTRTVESALLTFLGVNNSPIDKKERALTDEVNSNNQLIQSFADLQLIARQEAAQLMSEMSGSTITVKLRASQPIVENSVESGENSDDDES